MLIYFILSAPRSGSTLLRLHLNEFNNVIALPETHFFVFMQQYAEMDVNNINDRRILAQNWIDYHAIKKFPIDLQLLKQKIELEAKTWKDVFSITLNLYQSQVYPDIKSPIWIEKSPPHIFYQKEIRTLLPESKFIYLIRDPRSVIGSLKTMPWSTSNTLVLARSWKKSTALMQVSKDAALVKYEDIVTNPEHYIKKLFNFLNVGGEFKLATAVGDVAEQKNWNSSKSFKPISTDRLEKWKTQLSNVDQDLAIIEHVCKDLMEIHGYHCVNLQKTKAFYLNYIGSMIKFIIIKLLG